MSNSKNEHINTTVKRTFEGMPVVEAEKDLRITLMPDDIDKADRKSFDNCVFARACERQFGATKIVLMRTRAYIAIPDKDGKMRVERFVIPEEAQKIIRNFDKGETIKANTSFFFEAPKESRTLEYIRKKDRERSKTKMNNELTDTKGKKNNGSETRKNSDEPYTSKPKVANLDVRNGTGMIHTTNKS